MEEDEIQNEMWLWEGGELRRTIERIYSRVRRRISGEMERRRNSVDREKERSEKSGRA